MTLLSLLLAATPVHVSNDACPLRVDEVQRLTQLELSKGPERTLPVILRCDERSLRVTIDDPITGKTLSRALPLDAAPPKGLERYTALAIAELVEASWSELLLPGPSISSPAIDRASATQAVQTLPSLTVRLLATGHVRGYPSTELVQFGGGVRGHLAMGHFGGALALNAEAGTRRTEFGLVSADGLGGALFFTFTFDAGPVHLLAGIGPRASAQRLVGVSNRADVEGKTISSFLVGSALLTEAALVFGHLEFSLSLEAGVLVNALMATANGTPVAGLRGPWLTAGLGVGWRR